MLTSAQFQFVEGNIRLTSNKRGSHTELTTLYMQVYTQEELNLAEDIIGQITSYEMLNAHDNVVAIR